MGQMKYFWYFRLFWNTIKLRERRSDASYPSPGTPLHTLSPAGFWFPQWNTPLCQSSFCAGTHEPGKPRATEHTQTQDTQQSGTNVSKAQEIKCYPWTYSFHTKTVSGVRGVTHTSSGVSLVSGWLWVARRARAPVRTLLRLICRSGGGPPRGWPLTMMAHPDRT